MQKTIVVNNLSELPLAATELLAACKQKKIFAFNGAMGAGKTTFIKALCQALGVKNTISSPTFSIVNEYFSASGIKIYHFDFYRINSQNEAYDMGYEDYFYSNAYCFVEWSEKIAELIPPDHVKVNITIKDEQRLLTVEFENF
jgi:tRNA threonylcarbamoyladenosine biosynthesis protein TsaE